MRKLGKGNRPERSDTLTDTDIAAMYASGALGRESPDALLHTLWRDNVVFLGIENNTEHYKLRWGDIVLKQDPDSNNLEYLEMNAERGTKTTNGEDPRNRREVPARAWCLPDNPERCPVTTYKFYHDRRPEKFMAPDTPYYLAVLRKLPSCNIEWFKCQPVGKNKIATFIQTMVEKTSSINKKRKLTNISMRKYQVAKLDSCDAVSKKQQLEGGTALSGTAMNQLHSMQRIAGSSFSQAPTAALKHKFTTTQSTLSAAVTQPSTILPGGFIMQSTSATQFTTTPFTASAAIPQLGTINPGGILMRTTSTLQPTMNAVMNPIMNPQTVFINTQPQMMLMNIQPSNQMQSCPPQVILPMQPQVILPMQPQIILPMLPRPSVPGTVSHSSSTGIVKSESHPTSS